jgi:rhodanese-related sulfurtransferase
MSGAAAQVANVEHVDLSPHEVAEQLAAEQIEIVDVREPHEHAAGHVAGARHVPLQWLGQSLETFDRDTPLVFVCRVGARSAMAAEAFREAGFNAHNLAGGMLAWEQAGLPIAPDGGYVANH